MLNTNDFVYGQVLSHIPILGRLFGSTDRHSNRAELLVLITPRIIASGTDARKITLEYQREFESLEPLRMGDAEKLAHGH